jgi:hypothetical protein
MVKHVVLWKFKDSLTEVEKDGIKNDIKRRLQNLNGQIEGVNSIEVHTEGLESSNMDVMAECELANKEALVRYNGSPEHQKIKDESITPYMESRNVFDWVD